MFRKSKTNMMVIHLFFFVSVCYSRHSEIPHSQRNIYRKMKEEITSQKKPFIAKKKKGQQSKRDLRFFYFTKFEQASVI